MFYRLGKVRKIDLIATEFHGNAKMNVQIGETPASKNLDMIRGLEVCC